VTAKAYSVSAQSTPKPCTLPEPVPLALSVASRFRGSSIPALKIRVNQIYAGRVMLRECRRSSALPSAMARISSTLRTRRLRVLLIILTGLVLLTFLVDSWPFGPPLYGHPKRRLWSALEVSFVGSKNGTAIIDVKNRSTQIIDLYGYLEIDFRNPVDSSDYFPGGYCMITTVAPLLPRSALRVPFPAPTNKGPWRVAVRGVGQRDRKFKQSLVRIPLVGRHFDSSGQGYAQTEWIEP
jgi:hypothetical protein